MRLYQQLKNTYHAVQAYAWRLIYGMPDRGMRIYGITGTNGKTTTSYILDSVLVRAHGRSRVGMLTTVAFRAGDTEEVNTTKLTTLPSRLVYSYLKRMKKAGVTHVVLEMTSHALDQHRLAGIRLDGAIILNLAREHLDYHGTMEAYARAKTRIVRYLREGAPIIVRRDKWFVSLLQSRSDITWFSSEDARDTHTSLEGEVNKENAYAVSLLARKAGIDDKDIRTGIEDVSYVPGRMEWIDASVCDALRGKGFSVVIDYAVTPDALERLYTDMRRRADAAGGRVLALLGAAGLRDRGKRPDMARIVQSYADELVITREDPWTEDEEQIFRDLEKGLRDDGLWKRVEDRKEAISHLVSRAKPGDIVVVTGKGAERGMGIGKRVIPWNEREVILEAISKL